MAFKIFGFDELITNINHSGDFRCLYYVFIAKRAGNFRAIFFLSRGRWGCFRPKQSEKSFGLQAKLLIHKTARQVF